LIAGGLFRESMAQFATDIMDDRVGLFIACPNDRANHGDGQHLYIPRTVTLPFSRLPMMQFVGNLMGVAIRTQEPLPISLPPLIWKLLVCDMRTPWLTGMCQDLSLSLSLVLSLTHNNYDVGWSTAASFGSQPNRQWNSNQNQRLEHRELGGVLRKLVLYHGIER
jgi:hypothetical protein